MVSVSRDPGMWKEPQGTEEEPQGTGDARDFFPPREELPLLREAVQRCEGCGLYAHATQAVFGEGAIGAAVMLVGEQPGDKEDVAGHPFVGPAGKLLDTALEEAGIDRSQAYVTNVVKHFKWKRTVGAARAPGKRRLHEKPNAYEVTACRPWLEAEIRQVGPKIVVCLGSTAAQALLGKDFRVTRQRGEFFASELAPFLTATVHPSSILRAPDADAREQEMRLFIHDLRAVADKLADLGTAPDEPVAGGASGGGYT
jgi:uracil-DNA glycosylase family protein